MSNLTDKNGTRRPPLAQVNHEAAYSSEHEYIPTDTSLKSQGLNVSKRSKADYTNSKSQYEISSFEKNYMENELIKGLQNALQEAMEENTILREKVMELEALLAAAGDEIEKRDNSILELADYIEKIKSMPLTSTNQTVKEDTRRRPGNKRSRRSISQEGRS